MKKLFVALSLGCLGAAAPLFADGTNQFTDEKARVSYAFGLLNGQSWKSQDVDIDPELFAQGAKAGISGGPALMTTDEAKATFTTFRNEMMAKVQEKRAALGIKNKAEGDAFLATNKVAAGVKVLPVALPNGQNIELQYQVLTPGTGPIPTAEDKVSVNYRGTLLDGTEFDSSYKRGQPASFPVTGVIRGWTEALEHMPVGSKWKLFIPADLAYGERGPGAIPPNATLIFEVELLSIEPPAAPAAPPAQLTSDIIKVPSKADLDKGAKIETIKQEDLQKMQQAQQQQQQAKPQ
jgi:FKBP-type peptidyl-prolyl cis-trans isomerase FklB